MLQTYEAILEKGQIRWIDTAPTEQSAHLCITILPQMLKPVSSPLTVSQPVQQDMIQRLTQTPVKIPENVGFLSREQANAR